VSGVIVSFSPPFKNTTRLTRSYSCGGDVLLFDSATTHAFSCVR
jgi:hypothetical protein